MEQTSQTEKDPATSKNKPINVIKLIGNVIFYVVIVTFIVAGIIGIIGKIKGKNNSIVVFGYSFYVVQTNSMERKNDTYAEFLEGHDDQIQVGDLVITKKIPKKYDLQLYDIVTFERDGKTIIHRIVKISESSEGLLYTTRGDSNNQTDGKRSRDLLTGILVKNAGPKAGKLISFLQSTWGIAAIAGSFAVVIIAYMLLSDDKNKKKKSEAPTAENSSTDDSPADDAPTEALPAEENEADNDTAQVENSDNTIAPPQDGPIEENRTDAEPANDDIVSNDLSSTDNSSEDISNALATDNFDADKGKGPDVIKIYDVLGPTENNAAQPTEDKDPTVVDIFDVLENNNKSHDK